jgi:hypothetical protein
MREVKMQCRIEEITFLAEFTREYFVRDRADFAAFSEVFNDVFLKKFDAQIKKVKEIMAPSLVTVEIKTITSRIENHYATMRSIANRVERYALMAKGTMNTRPADFGFRKLRNELQLNNDEAVVKKLRELWQHIDKNREALEANGLSKEHRHEIEMAINAFEDDIIAQTCKMEDRQKLVRQNIRQFDSLWNMITEILSTGKVLYKTKNRSRLKNYTYAKLIKNVRLTHMKEEDKLAAKKTKKRITRKK